MKALQSESERSFAFGPFVLVPGQQLLLQGPHPVAIGGRAFDLLRALVERPGEVVAKSELMARVWPGLVVEDTNLKVNMAALRRVLGEGPGTARYIATVIGVGYRFVAPVGAAARVPAAPRRPGNLPPPLPRLFGREDSVGGILATLAQARLVSIVGPGGVGKTTVALAAADRAGATFVGGAWFVDLAAVDDPSGVGQAIADILRSGSGLGTPARWPDVLQRDRDMLLVLDNCEHLIEAVAECADLLLRATKRMKIIATSREPLCIRGERVRRLGGLALPALQDGADAAGAFASPAVQLFAERAAFPLDDTTAPLVAAICHRLDGHALAIERVAGRVGSLGLSGLLDHLDRRFHMFDGCHAGPARHRTLTASVESSYRRLSDREQALLCRLSTVCGPFTLASAHLASSMDDSDPVAVIDDIASLVSKSLLLAEVRDGEMYYRMSHLTRAYATDQRTARADQDA